MVTTEFIMIDGAYRQEGLDTANRARLGFGPAAPGVFRFMAGGSMMLAQCEGAGHANETRPGAALPLICLEPGCGARVPQP